MAREIDQDVDLVPTDLLCDFCGGALSGWVPRCGQRPESGADHVEHRGFGIEKYFETLVVMRAHNRLEEPGHRVLTRVRRDVTNAKAALGVADDSGSHQSRRCPFQAFAPAPVFLKDRLPRDCWIVV